MSWGSDSRPGCGCRDSPRCRAACPRPPSVSAAPQRRHPPPRSRGSGRWRRRGPDRRCNRRDCRGARSGRERRRGDRASNRQRGLNAPRPRRAGRWPRRMFPQSAPCVLRLLPGTPRGAVASAAHLDDFERLRQLEARIGRDLRARSRMRGKTVHPRPRSELLVCAQRLELRLDRLRDIDHQIGMLGVEVPDLGGLVRLQPRPQMVRKVVRIARGRSRRRLSSRDPTARWSGWSA